VVAGQMGGDVTLTVVQTGDKIDTTRKTARGEQKEQLHSRWCISRTYARPAGGRGVQAGGGGCSPDRQNVPLNGQPMATR